MAKNASSKTSPVASAPASTLAAPSADNASAVKTNVTATQTDASEIDREGFDPIETSRPTPEQLAAEIKTPEDIALLRMALALAEDKVAKATPAEARDESLVRVFHLNRSKGSFIHGEHRLDPGSSAVVPKWVADLWIGHTDGTGKPHVALQEGDPVKPDAEKAKLVVENDELSVRVKALEAQLAAAHAAAKSSQNQL